MTFHLDYTACSCVIVCSCGWREVTTHKLPAWRAAAAHERALHRGQLQASDAYRAARRRPLL